MQWLEIMGPHASGKTTISRHLKPRLTRLPVKNKVLAPMLQDYDLNRPTTWKSLAHWQPFLATVEDLYRQSTDDRNPDMKRRRNLLRSVLRMSVVYRSDLAGVTMRDVLGSEGMRLSYVLRDPRAIRSYYEAMPVSAGVVVLGASPTVLENRNWLRVPRVTNLASHVAQGIRACSIAIDVLVHRTRVLRLDATRPVEDNGLAILEFWGLGNESSLLHERHGA